MYKGLYKTPNKALSCLVFKPRLTKGQNVLDPLFTLHRRVVQAGCVIAYKECRWCSTTLRMWLFNVPSLYSSRSLHFLRSRNSVEKKYFCHHIRFLYLRPLIHLSLLHKFYFSPSSLPFFGHFSLNSFYSVLSTLILVPRSVSSIFLACDSQWF